jgi:hypothetical protein
LPARNRASHARRQGQRQAAVTHADFQQFGIDRNAIAAGIRRCVPWGSSLTSAAALASPGTMLEPV